MKAGVLAKQFHVSIIALSLMNFYLTRAQAQESHAHVLNGQQHELAAGQQSKASALVKVVREGGLKLIGADYLVLADMWNAHHPDGPPQLMGQLFHLFESPNRFGLPAFYTLHVWAWKNNPNGAFVNWHPDVSCASFNTQ